MNRTVAYQETQNNFADVRQQIKGAQISSVKLFGNQGPAGSGDYQGQFGLTTTAQGDTLLYVSSVGGWDLVGSSGKADLPDEVVREDLANNFTVVNQRIEDCPITFLDKGTREVSTVAIKGPGHFYVYESNPVQVFFSADGADWIQLRTKEDNGDFADLGKANNFTNPNQSIQDHAIASILKGSLDPDAAGVTPTREGEIYVQLAEGTADRKARLWISNNAGGWKWELLTHLFDLPATVAQTSKVNDFQPTQQMISGKQIMSFVDGGNMTPEQSKLPADYDGQFYLAVYERVAGTKDVGIWVASGNQWLPISEDIDQRTIARTNRSNTFSAPEQILGEGGANARWLSGNRIKFSGASPAADGKWRVQNVGEITVYENSTTVPREISVWMGVSKNPSDDSNVGEWAMIWSNKHGDLDNFARLDKSNDFAPFQYIRADNKRVMINGGHEGGSASPKNSVVPFAPGDSFTQSFQKPGQGEVRNMWIAAIEGDTSSWKRILTDDDPDVVMVNNVNHFQTRNQFLGLESDTKRDRVMGSRLNHIGGSVYNGVVPTMFGEVVVCEEWDPQYPSDEDKKVVKAYLAVGTGRKSWLEIGSRLKSALEIIDDGTNN